MCESYFSERKQYTKYNLNKSYNHGTGNHSAQNGTLFYMVFIKPEHKACEACEA